MSISDTTKDAEQVQMEILRRMSEGQRLRMALEMSQATRDMVLSRIRAENPGWYSPPARSPARATSA